MVLRSIEYVMRLSARAEHVRAVGLGGGHQAARAAYLAIAQDYDRLADHCSGCRGSLTGWGQRNLNCAEGGAGLADRSSRRHRLHRLTLHIIVDRVAEWRRQRWTGKQIAAETELSPHDGGLTTRRLNGRNPP